MSNLSKITTEKSIAYYNFSVRKRPLVDDVITFNQHLGNSDEVTKDLGKL